MTAAIHNAVDRGDDDVAGNGEAHAVHGGSAGGFTGQLHGGDPDDLTVEVDQRAAGVAGVDGRVGLDGLHRCGALTIIIFSNSHGAAGGGDDPFSDGIGVFGPQRGADGQDRFTGADGAGIGEAGCGGHFAAVDGQDGDIFAGAGADQRRGDFGAIVQQDLQFVGAVNDMVVGDNIGFVAALLKDDAAAFAFRSGGLGLPLTVPAIPVTGVLVAVSAGLGRDDRNHGVSNFLIGRTGGAAGCCRGGQIRGGGSAGGRRIGGCGGGLLILVDCINDTATNPAAEQGSG